MIQSSGSTSAGDPKTSGMGQKRRLGDVHAMSALPPGPDVSLRRSEPTLRAKNGPCSQINTILLPT
jgi:hypothetical protein